MAFLAENSTSEPRSFSIGPLKVQLMTYSAANADVSGTITADKLSSVSHVIIDGALNRTAADSISGNVITLAFADPGAGGIRGNIIVIGK